MLHLGPESAGGPRPFRPFILCTALGAALAVCFAFVFPLCGNGKICSAGEGTDTELSV